MTTTFIDIFSSKLNSKVISLEKGENLFLQNSKVDYVYIIKSGRIKLIRDTEQGTSVIIHTAYADESFAEASIFSDVFHCHAIADCNTKVSAFSKQQILQELQNNSIGLLKVFASQVRELRLLNETKSIYSANDRIMAFIISNVNDNNEFNFSYSLADMAQKLGLASETLYRSLKNLEDDGLIDRNSNIIKVIN